MANIDFELSKSKSKPQSLHYCSWVFNTSGNGTSFTLWLTQLWRHPGLLFLSQLTFNPSGYYVDSTLKMEPESHHFLSPSLLQPSWRHHWPLPGLSQSFAWWPFFSSCSSLHYFLLAAMVIPIKLKLDHINSCSKSFIGLLSHTDKSQYPLTFHKALQDLFYPRTFLTSIILFLSASLLKLHLPPQCPQTYQVCSYLMDFALPVLAIWNRYGLSFLPHFLQEFAWMSPYHQCLHNHLI